jgi:hypothetical protein
LLASAHRARVTISVTRHRTVFASGRVSMMRTVSPAFAPSVLLRLHLLRARDLLAVRRVRHPPGQQSR